MKKEKRRIKEILLEGLTEIVLTLVCFGIGAFVFGLFGASLDSPNVDGDLIVLLGVFVVLAIFGVIYALVRWIKKTKINKNG